MSGIVRHLPMRDFEKKGQMILKFTRMANRKLSPAISETVRLEKTTRSRFNVEKKIYRREFAFSLVKREED
jgi:hypothetical protein